MVTVQFIVKVPDVDRVVAATKKFEQMNTDMGATNQRVMVDQNDSSTVTMLSDWESHDAMHEASEKMGDDFNREAGTEGLEWITHVWRER